MLERDAASSVDLPEARYSLRNAKPPARECVVVLDLARQRRTRTDQRHFAAYDVDEVWQLVDAGAPEKPTERMEPRVVADLEDRPVDFVEMHDALTHRMRAVDHRAKLE